MFLLDNWLKWLSDHQKWCKKVRWTTTSNYHCMNNSSKNNLMHLSGCWWSSLLLVGWWRPGSSKQCVWYDICPAGTTLWVCVKWPSAYSSYTTWWRKCWRSASTACITSSVCGTVWTFSLSWCVSKSYLGLLKSFLIAILPRLSLLFALSALFSVECCCYYHEHNQNSHGWQSSQRPVGEPHCSPQLWVFGQPAGPVQQRGCYHCLFFLGQGINLFPFGLWSAQNCHSRC